MGELYNTEEMTTFADYMEKVLYGPAGYYSSGAARSGKSGDYFTAPDVGSVFGQLLAVIFQEWERKLGADSFSVVEVGAGEGRLAEDILVRHPFRYQTVEKSASRVLKLEALKVRFGTLENACDFNALKTRPVRGVLFGNELIDAFPVHRVRMKNGKLEEAYVETVDSQTAGIGMAPPSCESSFAIRWACPSTPRLQSYFDRLRIDLPDAYETEVNLAMGDWLKEAWSILSQGIVMLIDYGRPAQDYYAPERTRGTLRSFSKHKVSAEFLNPSNLVDLTSDVDFTSLALDGREAGFMPLAFMEMGTFLMQGLEIASKDPVAHAALMAHRVGVKYLLHPEGLGSAFHVLILGKDVDGKDWVFEHNRLSRLGLPN